MKNGAVSKKSWLQKAKHQTVYRQRITKLMAQGVIYGACKRPMICAGGCESKLE